MALHTAETVADFIDREWGPVPLCSDAMMTRIWDRIIQSAVDKFGKELAAEGVKVFDRRKAVAR